MSITVISKSLSQTRRIGEEIGRLLNEGVVIKLAGDLGSGKTSIAQGIAKGLDVPPEYYITSPTFTLVNQYPGRLEFYHADLYRLGASVDLEDIGLLDILFEDGVVAVEWAEKLPGEFEKQITVCMTIIDDASREIRISARGNFAEPFLKKLEKSSEIH